MAINKYDAYPEYAKVVYQFGTVEDPADFDRDGVIDSDDLTLFYTNWTMSPSLRADPPLYIEGDYDRDGDVDGDDYTAFYADYTGSGGTTIEFGPCLQPPLWPEHRDP